MITDVEAVCEECGFLITKKNQHPTGDRVCEICGRTEDADATGDEKCPDCKVDVWWVPKCPRCGGISTFVYSQEDVVIALADNGMTFEQALAGGKGE